MSEISVIIPTFGSPVSLERTINSVLAQTFHDLEVIVVDDNDPGNSCRTETEDIVSRIITMDSRVKYIQHDHNKNGSAARNTGIKAATGKYIAFLDSDDEYMPERLEKCKQALENSSSTKFQGVYTSCEYRKNNKRYRIMDRVKSGNFYLDYFKLKFNLYTGSNIFITSEAATRLNGFDESFIRHQDIEFMIRFFKYYDIVGVPDVLVIKNFVGNNKPSAKKTEDIKTHFFHVFKKEIEEFDVRDREEIYSAHYRQTAEQFILEHDINRALYYYNKILRNHSLSFKIFARAVVYYFRRK